MLAWRSLDSDTKNSDTFNFIVGSLNVRSLLILLILAKYQIRSVEKMNRVFCRKI